MCPQDAKEFGLIDKILEHPPQVGEKTEEDEKKIEVSKSWILIKLK